MDRTASSRIDTIAPALLIGLFAYAVDPSDSTLIIWTIGSWFMLTLLVAGLLGLALARDKRAKLPTEAQLADHRPTRDWLVQAWVRKADLLGAAGRTEEALSAYDEAIRLAHSATAG